MSILDDSKPASADPPTATAKRRTRADGGTPRIFALLAAGLALFIIGPLLKLLLLSPWSGLGDVLGDGELHAAILVTLVSASTATLLAAGLGIPLAFLLARRDFRGRPLVEGMIQIPVLIPHPVAGIALLAFLGRDTVVGGALAAIGIEVINHAVGLVVAMAFVATPIFVSAAQSAFQSIDPRLERVARTLGDTPWSAFRRITLPLARRGLAAGALVTWARAVSEFGAIVVVAYHPRVASVLIYDRLTTDGLAGAVPAASLLVLVALVVVGGLAFLNRRTG
ncbi:MAG: ABC transporter permease [Gemmatimonadales bacterium]